MRPNRSTRLPGDGVRDVVDLLLVGHRQDPPAVAGRHPDLGLYPIVTFQYSSTTLYQVSYHIQYLVF
jgi:hypothetical protein